VDDLSDSRPEWEISLEVDPATGSDEETETSELQSLLKDIHHIITSLYNISIAIRNPVPRERLAKFAAIDVSHFKPWDIEHMRHKFPQAPEYLIKRLGEANCKRRQLLQYYKNHHDKIARYIDLPLPSFEVGWTIASRKAKATSQLGTADVGNVVARSKSLDTVSTVLQSQTTVTTIRKGAIVLDEVESDGDHLSQTSYATSTNQLIDVQTPQVPNAAAAFSGEPFQCPYCYQIIKIGNSRSWRLVQPKYLQLATFIEPQPVFSYHIADYLLQETCL